VGGTAKVALRASCARPRPSLSPVRCSPVRSPELACLYSHSRRNSPVIWWLFKPMSIP